MARDERPLDALARRVEDDGVASCVAVGCAARARDVGGVAAGRARWVREVGGLTETYFDLASLTKPMTAVAVASCGALRAATLGSLLPELAGAATAGTPIELLLAHRAGLCANAPLFEPLVQGRQLDPRAALVDAANALRDELAGLPLPADGHAPLYSDLGYVLAGAALARSLGAADAGEVIAQRVVAKLGAGAILGSARELEGQGIDLRARAAPTEIVPWRGGEVRARVHDENAWALTGAGASGHAGVFGTLDAVLSFGCAVLDQLDGADRDDAPFGRGVDLGWLVRERPGGSLRAGFDGKSAEGSSAGALASPRTFGHLGFTGTSLWIDPDAEAVVVLLTNRVFPTRDNLAIRAARPRVHDALFARAVEIRRNV